MREDRFSKNRERQFAEHGNVNGGHHFACFGAERREAENAIVLSDEGFAECRALPKACEIAGCPPTAFSPGGR